MSTQRCESRKELVPIRRCHDNAEAVLLQSALAVAGIRCFLYGAIRRSPPGPTAPSFEVHILVPALQAQMAVQLLDGLDHADRSRPQPT